MCSSSVSTPTVAISLRHGLHGDAFGGERLNNVARLHVGEIAQSDSALKAVLHLAGVVLKALQRLDLAGEHDHVVAQQAHVAVALDQAVDHQAAGHITDLANAEHLAYRGAPLVDL